MPRNAHTRIHAPSEGPDAHLWHVGAIRIVVLAIVAAGAYILARDIDPFLNRLLALFYVLGLASCLSYLFTLRRTRPVRLLTWAQVLVDFGIVAATVSFTGGTTSLFIFLFVVVILEAGLLLGPMHGFIFATLAALFVMIQLAFPPVRFFVDGFDRLWQDEAMLNYLYSFLVQALAFYLTAAISGYWNQRIYRMHQFQREILDSMNDGFLITNADGIITAQNKAADRLLEVPEGSTLGHPVDQFLIPEDGGECPIMNVLRTGRDYTRFEFSVSINNSAKVITLSTSQIKDNSGQLRALIAALADVTVLAEMREELKRQDRLAVVGELAASLAHEIRNPIAAIRGSLEELTRNMDTPALVDRLAAIAIRESDQLNYIISEFLDFAREPTIAREPIPIDALLEETAAQLRELYADHEGIVIKTDIRTNGCSILADRDQLKQVCVNLGKNAVEAMGSGGVLTITGELDTVSAVLRFEDEGPGIPPDQMARVFEPFYTTKTPGVGMGLAVCMRILTAHDGTIRPSLRKEGGACMTVRLPVAQTAE